MEAIRTGTTTLEPIAPSTTRRLRGPIALLAVLATTAIVIGLLVSSVGPSGQTSPTGLDRSYDQIELMRGAPVMLPGPVDTSYDRIETMRGLRQPD